MIYPAIAAIFRNESPESVFEVGCAAGMLMENFGFIKGGIDSLAQNITSARHYHPETPQNFVQWDATKTPWPIDDKSYDIVFTCGTLILIPNPFPVLKEMMRIAKDKVIIAEPHDEELDEYGYLGNVPQPSVMYDSRIVRNYKKVFDILGWKYEFTESAGGKDIFKVKVNGK